MNNSGYKNSISKWLFAVILLLSFFTFSGFVAQTEPTLNKPQTTLVVNSNSGPFKSINYKRALIASHSKDPVAPILIDLSRLYSQQVKIQITELTQSYIPTQTGLFYKPKTTLQNADDDSALILG
jgi:hypothetical protein